MRKIFISFFLLTISFAAFSTGWVKISSDIPTPAKAQLISSNIEKSVVKFTLPGFRMNEVQTPKGTAYTISIDKAYPIQEKGRPDLPKMTAALAIPDLAGMDAEIISATYKDFEGIEIAPSKGVISRQDNPANVPYTYGKEYSVNAFWPSQTTDLADPYIIRNVRGQNVVFYPFRYNPITKVLRVCTEITVEIHKVNDNGFNPLTKKAVRENSEFVNVYKRHFLNGDNISYTALDDYGKMLVICYGQFMTAIKPYVDWKNSEGYPTKLVNVSDIGTTTTAIKNYITSYYNANGLTFVLLVGDNPQIPTITGSGLGGPSDNAYGYLVGNDHYSDVFIGRFSAENVAQVETQVQRTLNYEKNPGLLTDDWYSTVIGIASDQGPGDDNEYDYQHIRNQQSKDLAFTYTMHPELFDGSQGGLDASGNPTPAQVSTEVNNGASLIIYTGHGSTTSWGTSGFSNTNVNALTNQGKLPFVWSVACVNGEFMNTTCFAEAWLRATKNGEPTGAVGFLGSTINQSWNSPMAGQDEMTDILVGTYPDNIKRTFAGLSINGCMQMIDEYGTDGANMADTWTVFGDPTLAVRTANPVAMTVTNDPTLFVGSTTLNVTCNINGARATASLNDSILATGLVVNNAVTLTFPGLPMPNDSVRLVVTAFNKLPYIVDIPVITPNGPYILYVNNHYNDTTGNNNHMPDYGEDAFLTLYLKNVGVFATTALDARLRTSDPYVTLIDTVENYGVIEPNAIKSVVDAFKVHIKNNIPEGHVINFNVYSSEDQTNWTSSFSLTAHAPLLNTTTVTVKDSTGNNNGRLDPGETAWLKIKIENNGSAIAFGVTGKVIAANPFVTINTAPQYYGNLDPAASNSKMFEVTVDALAPEGQIAGFMQEITANQGINAIGNFELTIGRKPVLIVDLDGNANSGPAMKTSVDNLGISADYTAGALPDNTGDYSAVFVCLGVFSDNHELTDQEGQQLATYLNNGGRLYMEGGDTWWYDTPTAVHPMFHIQGVEDGYTDLSVIKGLTGTFTSGMSFIYNGDKTYIDRITPGTGATSILKNDNPEYFTTIAYDGTTYKTIGSSSEFGGLSDAISPSTKDDLMQEYLNFFGIQPPPLMASFFAFPTLIGPGGSVNFSDYSTGNPVSWNWSFPGGTPSSSTEQNPVVVYQNEGVYNVQLIISNGSGTDTLFREDYVTVDAAVGVGNHESASVKIYPNPGNGLFTVSLKGSSSNHINAEVFDITGSKILTSVKNSSDFVIDLTSYPAGVYFIKINDGNTLTTRKLIINK